MKVRRLAYQGAPFDLRNPGMEITDREREAEWIEQMDTILIFVCPTSL